MKVPINWLKEFVALPKSEKDLTDRLTMVGHMLDKREVINGNVVLDLELRGNRADCYSIIGIAREVAAIYGSKFKYPQISMLKKGNITAKISVNSVYVNRVSAILIKNIVITDSPKWLREKLIEYGIEPINNIVDLTNYVMIETGQPMHAFDFDKIGNTLQIRLAKEGEEFTTFKGDKIKLTKDDLVWANSQNVISIAGAIGEKDHSILKGTKNILVEAANYDRANIRRTVYRHKLLTDAGIRHEKDLDPEMVEGAIGRFIYLLTKNKWGTCDLKYLDYYPNKKLPKKVKLDYDLIEDLGGVKIDKNVINKILINLSFKISGDDIEIPTYRTDIISPEDIVEEVLRIYGYDKIPNKTLSLEIPKNVTPAFIDQEARYRLSATSAGFNETISLSFVKSSLSQYNLYPQGLDHKIVTLINPPSPDNQEMRLTLLPNILDNCQKAIYEREENVSLFEIGKTYSFIKGKYQESRKIGFIYFKKNKGEFLKFKKVIESFFVLTGLNSIEFENTPLNLPLSYSYLLKLNNIEIGFGGRIEGNIHYLEIDLDEVLGKEDRYQVILWPKYPPQIEDITIIFPEKTEIGKVFGLIKKIDSRIKNVELISLYKDSYTFRVWYQDPKKTLTDNEVEKIRNRILTEIKNKFGGSLGKT